MRVLTAKQIIFTLTGKGDDGVADVKTSFALGERYATIRCEVTDTDALVPTDEYVVDIDQMPLLISLFREILNLRMNPDV
jgi:hypothetical protein